jgi:hypothetical protein
MFHWQPGLATLDSRPLRRFAVVLASLSPHDDVKACPTARFAALTWIKSPKLFGEIAKKRHVLACLTGLSIDPMVRSRHVQDARVCTHCPATTELVPRRDLQPDP